MPGDATNISASTILENAKALQSEMVAVRRQIHESPELSFVEFETAKFVAERLRSYGFLVTEGIAGTGIIADLGQGKTIAIRSEMDALPVTEMNRSMYVSKVPGMMHACGHDAHVACVLGAAKILSQTDLTGRVRIIFQPGEEVPDSEGKTGAFRMIESGAIKDVEAILGLHVDSTVPSNKIGIVAGTIAPVAQEFIVTVGESLDGHEQGSETVDTAVAAAKLLQSLFELTSKLVTAAEPVLLSVGSIRSEGDSPLKGAGKVVIKGAFKYFAEDMRRIINAEIEKICLSAPASVEFAPLAVPPEIAGETLTAIVNQTGIDMLGTQGVLSIKRRSWASDFSLYTELVPGAFIYLGAEIAHNRRIHHSATFDIDESGLYLGAALLAQTVLRFWSA